MRSIPSILSSRLKSNIQTRASKSDPSASLWVGRPNTVLVDDAFLERQTVKTASIEDVSIAVCHPKIKKANTKIYMAYISDGTAKVVSANSKYAMAQHAWSDEGFSQTATAVSIAFDGTMPKNTKGDVEFITDDVPWVFWVTGEALYGQKLHSDDEPVLLVEANCSDVSAIRAMWSSTGGFDFGLIVFFLLNGNIYYRQLIGGIWFDAEIVSFGPSGIVWDEITTFRTWDYRVGIQGKTTEGDVYELFTQFMGIGKQNAEHIEVTNVNAESSLIGVKHHNTRHAEHVEVNNVIAGAPYGGLYSTSVPVLISAYNIADEYGDWGKIVIVTFDNYLVAAEVATNYTSFSLVDSWGASYYPGSATLGEDGLNVTLVFQDFNPAYGVCEIRYTPGIVHSMATILVQATSVRFTPQNLNPPDIPQPEVESIWNE